MDCGAGVDWHRVWRTGGNGAAQHEEADRLFLDQPPWLRGAGNFQFHPGGIEWRDVRHAGARSFDRCALHAGWNSL